MKEHVQKPGVRQWAGEDLIELQAEPLRALEGFFSEYGNCVIKGCVPTANEDGAWDISAGLLGLSGADAEGNPVYKTVPFSGIAGIVLPVYFTLTHSVVERAYADNKVKPIAYDYRAAVSTIRPEGGDYLELTEAGAVRFKDIIQDAGHRFMTDAERTKLSGIEAGANNYVHPATHPAGVIVEDAMHRFFTDAERSKLNGIEAGAGKYVHPATHPASIIVEDATHRFTTNYGVENIALIPTMQSKLNGIEAGANKYVHPDKHPASMIQTDKDHQFFSDDLWDIVMTPPSFKAGWIEYDQAYEFPIYVDFAIISYRVGPYSYTPWHTALISRLDTTFYLGREGDAFNEVSQFSFNGIAIRKVTNPKNDVQIIGIIGFKTSVG